MASPIQNSSQSHSQSPNQTAHVDIEPDKPNTDSVVAPLSAVAQQTGSSAEKRSRLARFHALLSADLSAVDQHPQKTLTHSQSWRRSTRQAVSVSTDNNLRGQLPSISESSANIPGNAYLRRMMDAIAIDQPIGAVLTSITPPISNSPHVQVNADVHLAADGPQAVLGLGVGPSMAGSGPGNATQVDTFLLQEVPDENGQAAVNPSDATDPSMTPGQKRRVVQLPPTTEGGEPTLSLKDRSGSGFWKEQIVAFFQPSDNKLAMKLFGTRSALLKERRRQQQTGHWIIHPCSNFRYYWDMFMLILLIVNMLVLPVAIDEIWSIFMRTAFHNEDNSAGWIVYNSVSDTLFLVDITINFRTGVHFERFVLQSNVFLLVPIDPEVD